MNSSDFWNIFIDTGAPEAYLMYTRSRRMEAQNVSEHPGSGAAGDGLQ